MTCTTSGVSWAPTKCQILCCPFHVRHWPVPGAVLGDSAPLQSCPLDKAGQSWFGLAACPSGTMPLPWAVTICACYPCPGHMVGQQGPSIGYDLMNVTSTGLLSPPGHVPSPGIHAQDRAARGLSGSRSSVLCSSQDARPHLQCDSGRKLLQRWTDVLWGLFLSLCSPASSFHCNDSHPSIGSC